MLCSARTPLAPEVPKSQGMILFLLYRLRPSVPPSVVRYPGPTPRSRERKPDPPEKLAEYVVTGICVVTDPYFDGLRTKHIHLRLRCG